MAWLVGLTAVDLGLTFENGKHFAAYQEMSETKRQEVNYNSAFGTEGPVLRRKRKADEGTLTFRCILLREGAAAGMNDEDLMEQMEDFQAQVKRGKKVVTYNDCNWTDIEIRSGIDSVELSATITIPGYKGVRA